MDYTIPAIPTVYRGRRYRSRLEARWAAFFDLLGWNHEYEPCDLGSWSPDFAVWGARREWGALVEVKPIERWCRATARKMSDAVSAVVDHANIPSTLLLLGSQPLLDFFVVGSGDAIGWMGQAGRYETDWTEAIFRADALGRADLFPNEDDWMPQTLFWVQWEELSFCSVAPLWVEAGNTVQWKPPA